jgi:putative transposase
MNEITPSKGGATLRPYGIVIMNQIPNNHRRRSIRLKGYDYTQPGAYFITICTHQRAHVFGVIVDGEMRLNRWGEIVRTEWFKTAELRPNVEMHEEEFVVMPNHVHGIIWLVENVVALRRNAKVENGDLSNEQAEQRSAPTVKADSLGAIIRAYKSAVTYAINKLENSRGAVVWQRNYYEHVIRNEEELSTIVRYIDYNPDAWQLDRDNPDNIRHLKPPEGADDYLKDAEEVIGMRSI